MVHVHVTDTGMNVHYAAENHGLKLNTNTSFVTFKILTSVGLPFSQHTKNPVQNYSNVNRFIAECSWGKNSTGTAAVNL